MWPNFSLFSFSLSLSFSHALFSRYIQINGEDKASILLNHIFTFFGGKFSLSFFFYYKNVFDCLIVVGKENVIVDMLRVCKCAFVLLTLSFILDVLDNDSHL